MEKDGEDSNSSVYFEKLRQNILPHDDIHEFEIPWEKSKRLWFLEANDRFYNEIR
jgi:hypothetical protein